MNAFNKYYITTAWRQGSWLGESEFWAPASCQHAWRYKGEESFIEYLEFQRSLELPRNYNQRWVGVRFWGTRHQLLSRLQEQLWVWSYSLSAHQSSLMIIKLDRTAALMWVMHECMVYMFVFWASSLSVYDSSTGLINLLVSSALIIEIEEYQLWNWSCVAVWYISTALDIDLSVFLNLHGFELVVLIISGCPIDSVVDAIGVTLEIRNSSAMPGLSSSLIWLDIQCRLLLSILWSNDFIKWCSFKLVLLMGAPSDLSISFHMAL